MTIVNTTILIPTEEIQQSATADAIRDAMGVDSGDIAWNEIPAIIIDQENNILDGHHRVAAVAETLKEWRALIVDRAEFDAVEANLGHVAAVRWAADEHDDAVTWGAAV
jgi:hypothetical protein